MFPGRKTLFRACAALACFTLAGPACAAGIGGLVGGAVGGLPIGLPGGAPINALPQLPLAPLEAKVGDLGDGLHPTLSITLDSAIRPIDHRMITSNPFGQKIVRGEVLAVAPSDADLAAARQLNFSVAHRETLSALGLETASLLAPPGTDTATALAELRAADPKGNFDFDHIYDPSGGRGRTPGPALPDAPARALRGMVVGMIDGGVDTGHPSLLHADIVTHNVTECSCKTASAHGTAVASLLVGSDGAFRGGVPGARLFAADAFGGDPAGGSAVNIARALDWLAENGVAVVNASLAGPPNALLAAAVRAFVKTGHVLIAAAGNEGPSAPPAFPAAYEGVIGVTSVDSRGRLQLDANRGDVAFAALGVDVRAAALKRGYDSYTGTSFAAPVVTARFAQLLSQPSVAAARAARDSLVHGAQPLGDRASYGFGYLAPMSLSLARQ